MCALGRDFEPGIAYLSRMVPNSFQLFEHNYLERFPKPLSFPSKKRAFEISQGNYA